MLSRKNILFLAIALVAAVLVANICYCKCNEALTVRSNRGALRTGRGGRGRGRGGRGRGGRGGRGSRRRWVGPHRGYSYGRRHLPRYDSWWSDWWYYPTATVPLTYGCKSGCVNLGNGEWGCQFPGDGITQCQFAVDCEACDDRIWWRPTTWFY